MRKVLLALASILAAFGLVQVMPHVVSVSSSTMYETGCPRFASIPFENGEPMQMGSGFGGPVIDRLTESKRWRLKDGPVITYTVDADRQPFQVFGRPVGARFWVPIQLFNEDALAVPGWGQYDVFVLYDDPTVCSVTNINGDAMRAAEDVWSHRMP